MGKYVDSNLGKNEVVIKNVERNKAALIGTWIKGILFCWVFLIPLISAIIKTITFNKTELAITNKRIIGRVGWFSTVGIDASLEKVQNIVVTQPFFGKIFNYSSVEISTAANSFTIPFVKNADAFKNQAMDQIEELQADRARMQAEQMAQAMAAAAKNNT